MVGYNSCGGSVLILPCGGEVVVVRSGGDVRDVVVVV